MKKLIPFLFLFIGIDLSAQCVYEWGVNAWVNRVERAICKDRSGHIITNFSAGSFDYIKKTTSSGAIIFSKGYHADGALITWDCTTDNNDNIYVAGTYQGTLHVGAVTLTEAYDVCYQVFVMKFSPTGTLLWVKRSSGNYGSSSDGDDMGFEVSADDAGNCYLAGMFINNFVFGAYTVTGSTDNNFIAKLNGTTGNVMWLKAYNDYGNVVYSPRTRARKNGDFYQAANYRFTVHVDSTTTYPANINWGNNIYVALYDTNGNRKWSIVSTGEGGIQSSTLDSHENMIITGYMDDSLSLGPLKIYSMFERGIFFAKIDTSGNVLQLERIANCADDTADLRVADHGIDTDSLGNVYISGRTDQEVNFNGLMSTQVASDGHHSFVAKYDNLLTPLWYNTYESSTNSYGFNIGLVKLEHKNVYAGGYFYDNIIIDSVSFSFSTNTFYEYIAELCDMNGSFVVPVGIEEDAFPELEIFPNPATDQLNLIFNDDLKKYKISVNNILGEEQNIEIQNSIISISTLSPGIYFLRLQKGNKQTAIKFVKQ